MTLLALGIDVSKLKFDVALLRYTGKFKHRAFPNTAAGFAQLSAWLEKQKVERVHACLEATGAYSDSLAIYLHEQGQLVSKELSERLRKRGKCPMQIIGAAMRKLVHLAYRVLKSGRPFDPELKFA